MKKMKWINKIIWKRVFVVISCFLGLVFLVIIPWVYGWVRIFKWLLG